jgi:hypothetical protein
MNSRFHAALFVILTVCAVGQAAPIEYQLAGTTNTDGAVLDWGYFTTNGVVGEDIELIYGDTLLDYRLHITEGSLTTLLTPANSTASHLFGGGFFDISPTEIAMGEPSPTGDSVRIFRIVSSPGSAGIFTVAYWNIAPSIGMEISVSVDSSATGGIQPFPFLFATAVPEPTGAAIAAMLSLVGVSSVGQRLR